MTITVLKSQKLSFNEVARAVSYVNALGHEEGLEQKELKAEDVQKIVHFTNAVTNNQCQLLKGNAITLLRLLPSLLKAKSSITVHNIMGMAVPAVKDLYEKNPSSAEGEQYKILLETAGKVCFHPRLSATTEERRIKEFDMFKDIVGETSEYKLALKRYSVRHQRGLRHHFALADDPNAIQSGGRGHKMTFVHNMYQR